MIQSLVAAGALASLIWYTFETQKMRLSMQRQTDLLQNQTYRSQPSLVTATMISGDAGEAIAILNSESRFPKKKRD